MWGTDCRNLEISRRKKKPYFFSFMNGIRGRSLLHRPWCPRHWTILGLRKEMNAKYKSFLYGPEDDEGLVYPLFPVA